MLKINSYFLFFLSILFLNSPNVRLFSSTALNNNIIQSESPEHQYFQNEADNLSLFPIDVNIALQPHNWHFNNSTNIFIPPFMLSELDPNHSTNTFTYVDNINNTSFPIFHEIDSTNHNTTPSLAPQTQLEEVACTNKNKNDALAKKKKPAKTYMCPTCNKSLANQSSLKYHIKTHDPNRPKPYTCHHCNAAFALKGEYASHMRYEEETDEGRKCYTCQKVYRDKFYLRKHNKRVHPKM